MLVETVYTSSDGQSAKFFIPNNHKKIAVHVSSGKDSALCLYLLCEYLREHKRTDITIIAAHVIDLVRVPYSQSDFDKIIDKFKEHFSDIKFERDVVQYVERPGYPKVIETRKQMVTMIKNRGVQSVFAGRTRPPPIQFLEQLRIELNKEKIPQALIDRMEDNVEQINIVKVLDKHYVRINDIENAAYMFANPLLETDSFFSVDMYKKYPFLKDVLFPLTRSCVGGSFDTDFWKKPCQKCFWCAEKKKIFGSYDGGIIG